jgi:hypothetical protein
MQYLVSIGIFALAPAIGAGIGVAISEVQEAGENFNDLPIQFMQGKLNVYIGWTIKLVGKFV